ncbi:MAG: sulfotransferase domain-containing protein [Persicimonas sp.]
MKILQIGAPRVGNFWLWHIIQQVIERAGLPNKSLVREHEIHAIADSWELSRDRQSDIDILDIEELGLFWRISSVFRMPVEELGAYVAQSTHVSTQSRFCRRTPAVLSQFDRCVYLVRDPRDRLLSAASFAFTPYAQKYWPHEALNPVAFVEEHFDDYMEGWRWHLQDYLERRDRHDIHFVFYERLLHDFGSELARLMDYLGVELGDDETREIAEATALDGAAKNNKAGKWYERLDHRQKGRAVVLCGHLLDVLDYPRYRRFAADKLPSLPDRACVEGPKKLTASP